MQQQTSEQLRAWFRDVEPICAALFNAAHVICGNYALAEYATRSAILDVWLQNAVGGMGFRERLRAALRRDAFEAALSEDGLAAEFTWPGLPAAHDDDPILSQLARESVDTQRLAALRHGCGLSGRAIAQLTGKSQGQVRGELGRLASRCGRGLSRQDRAHVEAMLARRLKKLLSQRQKGTPNAAQIYRGFESEASAADVGGHRVSRFFGAALAAMLALLCAGAFWLFAVLVQPAQF